MFRIFILVSVLLAVFSSFAAKNEGQYIQPDNLYPRVQIETSMGNIVVELDRYRARITTDNFLGYVLRKDYDNTLIHRVEQDYLIQGGGFNVDYSEVTPAKPIFNESGNGLKNKMGTIAMAKQLNDAHSATNQFFFNLNNNANLDPGRQWGYAVFGEVIEGYEILEAMSEMEVGYSDKLGYPTVPKKMITIVRMVIIEEQKSND